jgi:hypothetical protein
MNALMSNLPLRAAPLPAPPVLDLGPMSQAAAAGILGQRIAYFDAIGSVTKVRKLVTLS